MEVEVVCNVKVITSSKISFETRAPTTQVQVGGSNTSPRIEK